MAATSPAATVRLTPVIVISRSIDGLPIAPCATSRSSTSRSSASRSSSRTCRSIVAFSSTGSGCRDSQSRPRRLNRSACGHRGIRCACRIECTSFLIRVRCRTTWFRRATSRRRRSVSGVRGPDLRQEAGRVQARQNAGVDLVRLDVGVRDRLHLQRIGDRPRAPRRATSTRTTAIALPVASTTTSSLGRRLLPKPSSAVRVMSTRPSRTKPAVIPGHRLREGAVDIHVRSHVASLPSCPFERTGAAGDTTPTDPRSRRNRASRRGGQLLTRARSSSMYIGLPALRAPGASVPDGRTIRRDRFDPSRTSAPASSYRLPTRSRAPQRRDQAPHRGRRDFPDEAAITRLVGAILLEQTTNGSCQPGPATSLWKPSHQ